MSQLIAEVEPLREMWWSCGVHLCEASVSKTLHTVMKVLFHIKKDMC